MRAIPTYIINLTKRIDRKKHVLKQFSNKSEFNVQIVKAVEHEFGVVGLWKTIVNILQNLSDEKDEFVLICEDDHLFTNNYSKEILFKAIQDALYHDCDILSGGVSWLNTALKISENTYRVEKFTGLQFTIIFRKFFDQIISAEFESTDVADYKISSISNKKFLIHPFISVQKEFGYSDVTAKNNAKGRVEDLFNKSSESIQIINRVTEYFSQYEKDSTKDLMPESLEDIIIPTYVVHNSRNSERLAHIKNEFVGKAEFDVNIVYGCSNSSNSEVLNNWLTIRKVVEMAHSNDDDVIIICKDTHEFSPHYSRKKLLQNIIEAYHQGTDILLGNITDFSITVPVAKDRLWLGSFSGAQFLILYKSFFPKILCENIDETMTVESILSELTSNKMVLCPFISLRKDVKDPYIKALSDNNVKSIFPVF